MGGSYKVEDPNEVAVVGKIRRGRAAHPDRVVLRIGQGAAENMITTERVVSQGAEEYTRARRESQQANGLAAGTQEQPRC